MANYRSDGIAGAIKELLTAEEVARRYGFQPGRSGFIQCPFHEGDNHGSLKLYPGRKGWHCFGCRRGGSVIDFVMELFGISFPQAVVRINADFGLNLTAGRPSHAQRSAVPERRNLAAQKAEARRSELAHLAREHQYWLEASKVFAPSAAGFLHPLYVRAVKRLPWLDYITDEMIRGGEAEYGRTDITAAQGGRTA